MKKILKILSIIFIILCLIFLVVELVLIIKAKMYEDEIPGIFGIKPMIVLSSSMDDTISKGDLVFVKEVEAEKLEIGDIISYRNMENTVTTHRIIDIEYTESGEIEFYTKGDNNSSADSGTVTEEEIEGVFIFKIAKLGSFLMYLQEPKGICTIILIVLIAGCIWILVGKKEDQLLK